MKLIIDIDENVYTRLFDNGMQDNEISTDDICEMARALRLGTPIPNNATNGDMIKAMFGADKVFGFIHYVHLMAKVGNWFNEGVVAEFDRDWWNAPYKAESEEQTE